MEERSQVAVGLAVLNHDASSVASGSWSFTYYVRRVQLSRDLDGIPGRRGVLRLPESGLGWACPVGRRIEAG